nr:unnamed protein product [Digitaria exilis]
MDHHTTTTPSSTKPSSSSPASSVPPDRALLAAIESAVERCTAGAGDDDDNHRHVHEILFLVSNSPGAITFLSRRITSRLESPRAAAAAAAIRSLLLVHRLLRAGDRYFEQDLRSLWSSRDLRLDSPLCSCSPLSSSSAAGVAVATGACAFVHGYSAYLEERMQWVINQAGNLEPAARRKPPSPARNDGELSPPATTSSDDGDGEGERLVWKLGMCQRLLDLAMQLLPDNNTSSGCAAARSAFGIVLRESFKVYEAFAEGLDAMMTMMMTMRRRSSRKKMMRKTTMRVSAHEVLKKACVQTVDLKEFYHKCKRMSNASKGLEYPLVRVVTPAMASAVMEMDPTMPIPEEEEPPETEAESSSGGGGGLTFASKMETTISTVWVEFEEDDKLICSAGDDRSLESRAAKRS